MHDERVDRATGGCDGTGAVTTTNLPRLTEAAEIERRESASQTLERWRIQMGDGNALRNRGRCVAACPACRFGIRPRVRMEIGGWDGRSSFGERVNGLTDQLQPKAISSTARSARSLAVTLSLTSPLVAIRHQGHTHEEATIE